MRTLVAALLVLVLAAPAAAQDEPAVPEPPPAKSLDELLEIVRQGRIRESAENKAREERFRTQKSQRQKLLNTAKAQLATEERRSDRLEADFNDNEKELAALEGRLRERLGSLGELFGIVRAVAGDTRGAIEGSLVSAQLPARVAFLSDLAQSRQLPSIENLERLWFVLQQEATESGKVVRFSAPVITTGGERVTMDVIRIGAFNAVADDEYLEFSPESQVLAQMARQPVGQFTGTIDDLASAESGMVGFALDPSRGQILSLLIDVPTFFERIGQGRTIGYIIIVLGAIGIAVALAQWGWLLKVDRQVTAQRDASASADNPLGRVLGVYDANRREDVETLELKLDEAILKETPPLERFLTTIRVLSVVTPLLGLLGTVTGMIQTFQMITLYGTGDPKIMAGGISEALVTTMLGLCAAIPLVLLHSFVSGRSRAIVQVLDEQSAGIIARHAEQRDAVA
jgi:biopolymer transport protein ExbB